MPKQRKSGTRKYIGISFGKHMSKQQSEIVTDKATNTEIVIDNLQKQRNRYRSIGNRHKQVENRLRPVNKCFNVIEIHEELSKRFDLCSEMFDFSAFFCFFFQKFSKFTRKFVDKNRFCSSCGRRGTSGKSRATRCQNFSLLRRLGPPQRRKNHSERF